jgi:hypothetical protein
MNKLLIVVILFVVAISSISSQDNENQQFNFKVNEGAPTLEPFEKDRILACAEILSRKFQHDAVTLQMFIIFNIENFRRHH